MGNPRNQLFFCLFFSDLAPDAHFTTRSWIERIVIVGATQPKNVSLKTAGKCVKHSVSQSGNLCDLQDASASPKW